MTFSGTAGKKHCLTTSGTVRRNIHDVFRTSWKGNTACHLQKQLERRHCMPSTGTVVKQTLHGIFRNSWTADIALKEAIACYQITGKVDIVIF
jgi:hypothetical protein